MGFSTNTYTYSGGSQTFSVAFADDFIKRSHVQVYRVGDVDGLGEQVYLNFTWNSNSEVLVTDSLSTGDQIVVERTVPKDELTADLSAAGGFTRTAITDNARQTLHAVHEALDGRLDYNVVDTAAQHAADAEQSASLAAGSAVDAAQSANVSLQAATLASSHADDASYSATAAAASATAASEHRDAAEVAAGKYFFDGRQAHVQWIADGGTAPDGSVSSDGTVQYIASAGATAISDMPGWLPFGDWTPRHFGALGNGSTDDTSAIQAADAAATTAGYTLIFTPGNYRANGLSLAADGDIRRGAKITYNGAENDNCVTLSGVGARWGRLEVDGNGIFCGGVIVAADGVDVDVIEVSNITGSATGDLARTAVQVTGANCSVGRVKVRDMANGGHTNGSFPQAVALLGDEANVDEVQCERAVSGLVLGSASGVSRVGSVVCTDMEDNGIYQLGGRLCLDSLSYHGTEEPAVFIGEASVGVISVVGPALGVGFQSSGDVSIGEINITPDALGASAGFLFRTRPGSVNTSNISIGRISGTLTGSSLFSVDAANPVRSLSIGSMNVRFLYDASVATILTSWADMDGALGFEIGQSNIDVIDVNGVFNGSQQFWWVAPAAASLQSRFNRVDVSFYQADGVTAGNAEFRGSNFAQTNVRVSGMRWRTDIGPYLYAATGSPTENSANAAPTAGTWVRGERLHNTFPSASGKIGWVCVASGTPGTWKTWGAIDA